jgi:ribosomal protein S17
MLQGMLLLLVLSDVAVVWFACRYEKRHTNISAHLSPCFRCKEGDTVVVGQCR